MKIRVIILAAACICTSVATYANAAPTTTMDHRTAFGGGHAYYHPPRYHEYQLDDVKIIASFDEVAGTVFGDVTNTVTTIHPSTTYLDFDSADLHYTSVGEPDGTKLRYQTFGETLRVFLPKPADVGTKIAVETKYSTHPTKGVYFVRPDSYYPDRPWEVWSQGEMVDNHFWFPTYDWPDEKATSETIISVPEGQTVVSNGRLERVTHYAAKKTVTYDWVESVPHSTYLISIVAGTFAQWTDHVGKLPVTYYAPPANRAEVAYDFRATPDMIAFFQQFNDYPFPYEKYAQSAVVDFTYGGMENMSATTQTATTLHDHRAELDTNSEGLVAHELAHQWWGDLETMQDWGQVWLNEGYATYYEALYRGHAHGQDAFDMDRQGMMDDVFSEDARVRRPIVTEVYGDPIDLFDADGYSKAGLVLHMFRTVLGTDEYRKSQTAFLREYATKSANTQEWEASVERTTGQDLHWFVDEWLYKAGYPEYKVSYTTEPQLAVCHVIVGQTQSTAWNTPSVFTMPVEIDALYADGSTVVTHINIDQRRETFDMMCPGKPVTVLFDPGHNILSKVTFKKSDAELGYQMRLAHSVLDRLGAAQELIASRKPSVEEIAGATWFLEHERFDDARAAIVDSLDNLAPDSRAREALIRALDDPSAHVRSAAAAALSDFESDPMTIAALKRLAASDPSYATTAASVSTLAQYDAPGISTVLARALNEPSNNGVVASAALHGYAIVEKRGAIALEERYAKYGAPQASRNAAIGALGTIGKSDARVTAFLTNLLGDPNFRTNFALFRALGARADPRAIPALERFAKTTEDVRLRQGAQAAVATIEAMTRRPTKRP